MSLLGDIQGNRVGNRIVKTNFVIMVRKSS